VTHAAKRFDHLVTANVFCALKIDWKSIQASDGTIDEFVDEFKHHQARAFVEGQWKNLGYSTPKKFDFGSPFGLQSCIPMYLGELKELPERVPTLKETGFYATGFNPVLDYVILPIVMLGLKLLPEVFSPLWVKLFKIGTLFSKPPFGVKLMAECSGESEGSPRTMTTTLTHDDEYVMTAVPVVACLLQYLDGTARKPGLWFQATAVEPDRFFEDMGRMGLQISIDDQQSRV
jgi:saccharopine dehydrogenase (NAD+, L-lysine-forming)